MIVFLLQQLIFIIYWYFSWFGSNCVVAHDSLKIDRKLRSNFLAEHTNVYSIIVRYRHFSLFIRFCPAAFPIHYSSLCAIYLKGNSFYSERIVRRVSINHVCSSVTKLTRRSKGHRRFHRMIAGDDRELFRS